MDPSKDPPKTSKKRKPDNDEEIVSKKATPKTLKTKSSTTPKSSKTKTSTTPKTPTTATSTTPTTPTTLTTPKTPTTSTNPTTATSITPKTASTPTTPTISTTPKTPTTSTNPTTPKTATTPTTPKPSTTPPASTTNTPKTLSSPTTTATTTTPTIPTTSTTSTNSVASSFSVDAILASVFPYRFTPSIPTVNHTNSVTSWFGADGASINDNNNNNNTEPSSVVAKKRVLEMRAVEDFKAEQENEISFAEGDILTVITKYNKDWFYGEMNGKKGYFPREYFVKNLTRIKSEYCNISAQTNYRWHKAEALREIVQNWIDECVTRADTLGRTLRPPVYSESSGTKKANAKHIISWTVKTRKNTKVGEVVWNKKKKEIRFVNEDTTLPDDFLVLGSSSKRKDQKTAGEHGEGAKYGIAVLLRNDCKVSCQTHKRQVWKFELKLDPTNKSPAAPGRDQRVLYCHKRNLPKADPGFNSVSFIIKNLVEEDFDPKKFLFLSPPQVIFATDVGELLLSEEYKGSVYVKGIFVHKQNLLVGINLLNAKLSRDRDMVMEYVVKEQIGKIWAKAIKTDVKFRSQLYKAIKDFEEPIGTMEIQSIMEGRLDCIDALKQEFYDQYRSPAGVLPYPVLVNDETTQKIVRDLELYPVFCNKHLYNILKMHKEYQSLDTLREQAFVTSTLESNLINGEVAKSALISLKTLLTKPPLDIRVENILFRPQKIADTLCMKHGDKFFVNDKLIDPSYFQQTSMLPLSEIKRKSVQQIVTEIARAANADPSSVLDLFAAQAMKNMVDKPRIKQVKVRNNNITVVTDSEEDYLLEFDFGDGEDRKFLTELLSETLYFFDCADAPPDSFECLIRPRAEGGKFLKAEHVVFGERPVPDPFREPVPDPILDPIADPVQDPASIPVQNGMEGRQNTAENPLKRGAEEISAPRADAIKTEQQDDPPALNMQTKGRDKNH